MDAVHAILTKMCSIKAFTAGGYSENTVRFHTPSRQIRCTVAQISLLPLSKPGCDWRPSSSLTVAAYRAGRGAAGVVHCGRQP